MYIYTLLLFIRPCLYFPLLSPFYLYILHISSKLKTLKAKTFQCIVKIIIINRQFQRKNFSNFSLSSFSHVTYKHTTHKTPAQISRNFLRGGIFFFGKYKAFKEKNNVVLFSDVMCVCLCSNDAHDVDDDDKVHHDSENY